jgi:hypothetical protein
LEDEKRTKELLDIAHVTGKQWKDLKVRLRSLAIFVGSERLGESVGIMVEADSESLNAR